MFPALATDSVVNVNVDIMEDTIKEVEETFTCSLSDSPSLPDVIAGSPSMATITIQDDDG